MRIFDCFSFYNEYELLEWRLKILYDVVDYFVISEMNVTHKNVPKPFNFEVNKELFSKYMDKIRYIKVDDTTTVKFSKDDIWPLENYQRDCLTRGLTDCRSDDLIIISDLDEIPDPEAIQRIKKGTAKYNLIYPFNYVDERVGIKPRQHLKKWKYIAEHWKSYLKSKSVLELLQTGPIAGEQYMYMYYVNYQKKSNWCANILILYKNISHKRFSQWRQLRNVIPCVKFGWHFTYMGGIERIRTKLESIAEGHTNPLYDISPDNRDEFLQKALDEGRMWWNDNEKLQRLDYHEIQIPEIEWFIKKYPEMYR